MATELQLFPVKMVLVLAIYILPQLISVLT